MNCNHCSHLRRGEGGIKIGGRVELTTVPGCPCAEFRKIYVGAETEFSGIETVPYGLGSWIHEEVFRCCPDEFGRPILPLLEEVTLDNYPGEPFDTSINVYVYPFAYPTCVPNTGSPQQGRYLKNFIGTITAVYFNSEPSEYESYYVNFWVIIAKGGITPTPPVITLKFNFDYDL